MAQDEFISKMDHCLDGLSGVRTIVDDIIVFGNDRATLDKKSWQLMRRCWEMGIKLNPDKTEIGKTQIPFTVSTYISRFESVSQLDQRLTGNASSYF